METLIKMTDYLPDNPYSKFLKQTPQIWMFVPCDSEGNVLELPKVCICTDLCSLCKEYQQAKESCYFDGFEVHYSNNEPDNKWIRLKCGKLFITFFENRISVNYPFQDTVHITTLEQLIDYNLTLTATAQKEIV